MDKIEAHLRSVAGKEHQERHSRVQGILKSTDAELVTKAEAITSAITQLKGDFKSRRGLARYHLAELVDATENILWHVDLEAQ